MKAAITLRSFFLCCIVFSLCLYPKIVSAGVKNSIQQKLNAPNNIQYEPYYLDSESPAVAEGQSSQTFEVLADFKDKRDQANESLGRSREKSESSTFSRYAVYQSHYKAELEENVVTVKGEVSFQVFQKGLTQLPLVNSQVGLIDVSVNRGAAYVIMQGGIYYLIIDKPGKYSLTLEFLIKASREREHGPGSFNFEVVPAPISQFELTMPETGIEIFVDPAIKVEIKKEPDKTLAWAIMPNTRSITARWTKELHREEITPIILEPKVYADTSNYVTLGEGVIQCRTQFNYSILQSEVSSFRLSFPNDISILEVNGRDLRDWKVTQKEESQFLDVYLNFGVKGNYALNISYEKNIGEGSVIAEIPAIKAEAVERETGYLGIASRTSVELAINKLDKVTAIDVKELPAAIWSSSANPILLAFKYLNHPFQIIIEVTKHEEIPVLVAVVDSVEYSSLYTLEGKVLTKATFHLRNNVKQFLRLELPPEAVLWSSFVASKPVKPAKDKNGSILIPLEKSQLQGESLTRFPVEIVYLDNNSELQFVGGKIRIPLPKIDIPISSLDWKIFAPEEFTYFNFKGNVQRMMAGSFFPFIDVASSVQPAYQKDAKEMRSLYESYQEANIDRRGLLPIKIEIPQRGKLLGFSKLLVTEQESPWVSFQYTGVINKISGLIKLLIVLGIIFLFLRIFLKILSKKKK